MSLQKPFVEFDSLAIIFFRIGNFRFFDRCLLSKRSYGNKLNQEKEYDLFIFIFIFIALLFNCIFHFANGIHCQFI